MHELLLFLPGAHIKTEAQLIEAGHGDFAELNHSRLDQGIAFFTGFDGPSKKFSDGETGTLVVIFAPDELPRTVRPTYEPTAQTWISSESEWDTHQDPAWFGWSSLFPPNPQTLRRRTQYVGPVVELGGEQWMLPLYLLLPLRLAADAGDTTPPARMATPADRLAHRLAAEIGLYLKDPKNTPSLSGGQTPPPGTRALVEHALARNYRGDWKLWDALGLFDDAQMVTLAMLAVTGISGLVQLEQHGEL